MVENEQNTIDHWKNWFNDVYNEAVNLRALQHVFQEVQKIIATNKKIHKPSAFYDFIKDTYATAVSMGVRRICDNRKNSRSFLKLLEMMRKNHQYLSRTYYRSLYEEDESWNDAANKTFDSFVGAGKLFLSKENIDLDILLLKKNTSIITSYVDKCLAHRTKERSQQLPTYNNLHASLDVIEKLVIKYSNLLRAKVPITLTPTFQYDWTAIFQEPWLTRESNFHSSPSPQSSPQGERRSHKE